MYVERIQIMPAFNMVIAIIANPKGRCTYSLSCLYLICFHWTTTRFWTHTVLAIRRLHLVHSCVFGQLLNRGYSTLVPNELSKNMPPELCTAVRLCIYISGYVDDFKVTQKIQVWLLHQMSLNLRVDANIVILLVLFSCPSLLLVL